eukprot:604475-Prorocentrum_minimum.AAC.1
MDNPQLGRFSGLRKYSGGESNSPVVEWRNKGLTAVSSPTSQTAASQTDWSAQTQYVFVVRGSR